MEVQLGGASALVDRPISADGEVLRRASVLPRRRARSATGLIVHHRDGTAADAVADILGRLGVHTSVSEASAEALSAEGLGLAVMCGFEALGEGAALEPQLEWVRTADRHGTPILGIGRGALLLALALGGDAETLEQPQRGWTMTASVVPHLISGGPWLTWQHERLRVPDGAEVLAANRLGPQAFRVGRHVGIQFHPEAVPGSVERWARSTSDASDPAPFLRSHAHDPAAAAVRRRRLFSAFVEVSRREEA